MSPTDATRGGTAAAAGPDGGAARPRWTALTARAVLLPRDDVDTDQIIPARFLTTTQRAGLGAHCFADWRYDAEGAPRPDFPLNRPESAGAAILVAGHNFGCGSSREHAPWALADCGFRAVIAGSFADIFRTNALKNGLLTVALGDAIGALHAQLAAAPDTPVRVDLEAQAVAWGPGAVHPFEIDAFSRRALLEGLDELGLLLADLPTIIAWELRTGRGAPATHEPT